MEFLKSDLYFRNYEHLKLMFFKRIGPKKSWSSVVGTSTNCHSFISEYFHSLFCSKVEGSMLNKTTQSFSLVTFKPWLIVVIGQHVFHVHSSMTIFYIPITQIVQLQKNIYLYNGIYSNLKNVLKILS